MKFNGKYSLRTHLLRENKLTYRVDDQTGEYYVNAPDGTEIGPYPDKKAAASAYSARLGSHSETPVADYLNGLGFNVSAIGGSGKADVQGTAPDGTEIRIEVGTPDKVKQLGAFDASIGKFKEGYGHPDMQEKVYEYLGDSFQLGKANNTLAPEQLAELWKACGDDIILRDDEQGGYKVLALTPSGQKALQDAGFSVPIISAANCGNSYVGSGGGGARGGIPTFGFGTHIKHGTMVEI